MCQDHAPPLENWGGQRGGLDFKVEEAPRSHALSQEAALHAVTLREADHRIKNSLQLVIGLLRLQARRELNPSAKTALQVAAERVFAIARMHDALQAANGEDRVDIGSMVDAMGTSLQQLAGDPATVSIRVKAQPMKGYASLGQPIILILNELVINALRPRFANLRAGTIDVDLRVEGDCLFLVVSDDGAGLPARYAATGFGMRLIRALCEQIGGSLKVESAAGARFTLSVPIENVDNQIRQRRTNASFAALENIPAIPSAAS